MFINTLSQDQEQRLRNERVVAYLGVGSVGAELVEDERVDESHVAGHLLHPPQLPLLLRVGEFHHKARRSTLSIRRI